VERFEVAVAFGVEDLAPPDQPGTHVTVIEPEATRDHTERMLRHFGAELGVEDTGHGIAAGLAHMRLCIASGVRTPTQMASCHVSGSHGWKVRLNNRSENYRRQYVKTVMR
jgi:hypothetical protein